MIYRFRPRLNPQVNGYFICDEGRLSYHRENEGRLTSARIGSDERPTVQALETARRRLEASDNILILVSPNCSLEQMLAIKSLAAETGATVSGFSDACIKRGDADGYLIQDDKSANRAGLDLLGFNTTREFFEASLKIVDTLVCFNNDLFVSDPAQEPVKKLTELQTIAISTHDTPFSRQAGIAIPTASFTEYAGSVINKDGILQTFSQAVQKNDPPFDIIRIAGFLGASLTDPDALLQAMKRLLPAFAAAESDQIPEQGLKLTPNEAAHVTA